MKITINWWDENFDFASSDEITRLRGLTIKLVRYLVREGIPFQYFVKIASMIVAATIRQEDLPRFFSKWLEQTQAFSKFLEELSV